MAADDLVQRLLDHCALMCETGAEGPIADAVAERYADHPVVRVGNSLVVGGPSGDRPVVALVGHLDVVAPTDDDREPRVEARDGGDVVVARGASDMKAGNVVAMRVYEEVAAGALASDRDVVLVLYAAEEGPAEDNELADVLAAVPWLADVALAIVLEPTDGEVQLGCLGGLHATLTVPGRQAHSARPWHGRNAVTRAGGLLSAFDALAPVEVDVDGITFRDVWSITQAATSNGRNVIPGSFDINLNLRFAPSRDLAAAEAELRSMVATVAADTDAGEVLVEITDTAPPAHPHATTPAVAAVVAATGAPDAAKQAWTDVARFGQIGVPALNYGPGRTDQAHQRGEYVEVAALATAYDRLVAFIGTPATS